jgi:hypothetical protein
MPAPRRTLLHLPRVPSPGTPVTRHRNYSCPDTT